VQRVATGEEEGPDAMAFFGKILVQGCRQIFKRGIGREYVPYEEERSQLRGRINLIRTFRHDTLRRGRVWCRFDELTADGLNNQLLKATLIRLLGHKQVSPLLSADIRKCIRVFDSLGVKTTEATNQAFRRVQLNRNSSFYSFLLHVCELVHEGLFPETQGAEGQFASLLENEAKMNRIFERFVRNFFRYEQGEFMVTSERIGWDISGTTGESSLLPSMHTDASLRSTARTVIVETKYYSQTLHSHYERKTLRSGHLYQLFAYLKNLENRGGPDSRADGVLLYPTVQDRIEFETVIQGHKIRAVTIDLNQPWEHIRDHLLSITAGTS
jgi:5-methylcytosine-specific restriction enzyme subunit McrC